jgi:hypothetical protein
LPFTLLVLSTEAACGFFKDMSMTPASDMAPNILTVTPLAFGTVRLAGLRFKGEAKVSLNMQIETSVINENTILSKVQILHLFPTINLLLSQFDDSISVPRCSQAPFFIVVILTLHNVEWFLR